jgi:hypothetical protein
MQELKVMPVVALPSRICPSCVTGQVHDDPVVRQSDGNQAHREICANAYIGKP